MKSATVALTLVVALLVIGRGHAKRAESLSSREAFKEFGGTSARKLAGWVATRPGGARRALRDVAVDVGIGDPIIKKHHPHPHVIVKQSPVVIKQPPITVKKSPVTYQPVAQKVPLFKKHPFFNPLIAKKGLFG